MLILYVNNSKRLLSIHRKGCLRNKFSVRSGNSVIVVWQSDQDKSKVLLGLVFGRSKEEEVFVEMR